MGSNSIRVEERMGDARRELEVRYIMKKKWGRSLVL